MSDHVRIVTQGHSFDDGTISVSWGAGSGAVREVRDAPPATRSAKLVAAIDGGFGEETTAPVPPAAPDPVPGRGIPTRAIEFTIDGGGSAITTGVKGDIEVPFAW